MHYNISISTNESKTATNMLNKIDIILCYLCIIDILFLPYIRVLSASISMILVPLWFLFNLNKIKINKEFKLFFIMLFFMTLSLVFSTIKHPDFLKANITTMIIIIYGFLYYFFFVFCFKRSVITLKNFFIAYIAFGVILSLIYYVDAAIFFRIRTIWTMSGNIIDANDMAMLYRFTSTFSDPNNAATVFVAVFTFILFNNKLSMKQTLFVFLGITFIIINTMSNTGFILLGITLFISTFSVIKKSIFSKFKVSSIVYIIILILLLIPLVYYLFPEFMDSSVVSTSLTRVRGNSVDSRITIWGNLLRNENIFKYILYGMGGTVALNGNAYKPHNGHLHLIYNYGMIAYAIFMYTFFKIKKDVQINRYFCLIPFFLGFSINVGIYEPRFINVLAMLAAWCSSVINLDMGNNKEKI